MSGFGKKHLKSTKWLLIFWVLALVSVAGIYFNIGPNKQDPGGGGFIWVLPALVFSILALGLSIMRMLRK
jgi:hypothetical protein